MHAVPAAKHPRPAADGRRERDTRIDPRLGEHLAQVGVHRVADRHARVAISRFVRPCAISARARSLSASPSRPSRWGAHRRTSCSHADLGGWTSREHAGVPTNRAGSRLPSLTNPPSPTRRSSSRPFQRRCDCGCRWPTDLLRIREDHSPLATRRGPLSASTALSRAVPHASCGRHEVRSLRLRIPWIRTGGTPSYGAVMPARLTHQVEKRSDAPDTSANRAHRVPAASAPVMDHLDVAIVPVIAPRDLHVVTNHAWEAAFRATAVGAWNVIPTSAPLLRRPVPLRDDVRPYRGVGPASDDKGWSRRSFFVVTEEKRGEARADSSPSNRAIGVGLIG
jgi:hypothetical protein